MSNSQWAGLYGENKIQRPVVINTDVPSSLPAIREANLESRTLDRNQVYGSSLGSGRGTPSDLLRYNENEPAFFLFRKSRSARHDGLIEPKVSIIQSLNGMYIDEDAVNSDEITDQFRCGGITLKPYDFGIPEQTPNGLALMVGGSIDITNNSPHTWMPGDRLTFRAPRLNPQLRESERSAVGEIAGENLRRIRMIIEPVSHTDMHLFFEKEFTKSFDANRWNDFSIDRWLAPRYTDTPAMRAAASFKHLVSYIAWVTISVLRHYGVGVATGVAVDAGQQVNRAQYNALVEKLEPLLEERTATIATALRAAGSLAEPLADEDADNRVWQSVLGLMPTAADRNLGGPLPPSMNLCNTLAGLVGKRFIMQADINSYFNILKLFPQSAAALARVPAGAGFRANKDNRVGAMLMYSTDLVLSFTSNVRSSVERILNRYVGTVLEVTDPTRKGSIYRG